MISILQGGITHHYTAPNLNYCNTINNVGSIYNQYTIVMVGSKNAKVGFLKGKDSVCANIAGPISSFRISNNVDFMLGGYNANSNAFRKRNMVPIEFGGVTPVVGFNFKIPITKSIEINNLVSIGIVTHAISVSF